ncbi:arginine--tRNA ligase [Candidatus Azambacteria bacterium]|nr:arginine--tRNA ligase [Candidatus Azambacteria bacterium]
MNIYRKIADAMQDPSVSAFVEEEKIGLAEVKHIKEAISQKEKQEEFLDLPEGEDAYPFLTYKHSIRDFLRGEYGFDELAEVPKGVDADFAIPCFSIAMIKGIKPQEAAIEIAEAIKKECAFIERAEVTGGYVNIYVDAKALGQETIVSVETLKEHYGASRAGKRAKVVIEYSSPNAAKPMSVGHLRSTIIGESLKKIYEAQGFTVIGIDHVGDFGTQFGKLLYAISQWKDDDAFAKEPVKEMLRLYVKFHEEAKSDPTLEDKGREMFQKLEAGDAKLARQWADLCAVSADDFEKIYAMLGVKIDLLLGESFYQSRIPDVIARCLEKNIAVKNEDGSVAVNFADEEFPSFLLAKKDGSSLYAARDIAAAEFRLEQFDPVKIIYVVGGEQTLHFRQVFKTLGLLGHDAGKFTHDSFGLVSLPEGKMSTREGRVIFLEDLINESIERARKIVAEKNPELTDAEKKEIAEAVGIGAIIYNDLSQSREKNIQFTWDRALSMEGNSAPYLQYAYARAMSIVKKAGDVPVFVKEHIVIEAEQEQKLVRMIARLPEAVQHAQVAGAPHIVATYLNALVQEFSRFYNECPVLTAEGATRETRLHLVRATAQVIKNGLFLLGIRTLDRM